MMPGTMPNPKKTAAGQHVEKHAGEPQLKGAFASVLLLAGFIVLTWLLVFGLYLSRL